MNVRPLHDYILVELEPEKRVTKSGLIIPQTSKNPVSVGKVIRTGPGRLWKTKSGRHIFWEVRVKAGDRVIFFTANLETGQGKRISYILPENQELIPETAILGVVEGDVEVTV